MKNIHLKSRLSAPCDGRSRESGNVIFFILLAILLIGIVTAAVRSGALKTGNIDREQLIIRASEVRRHSDELTRAVRFILQSGISESDIRFAHPDASADYGTISTNPSQQVFHPKGGGAEYRAVPNGISYSSGWEFYGHTAMPDVGTARADLVAVIPNVTSDFCDKINEMNGYTSTPVDTGTCLSGDATKRFDDFTQYDDTTTNTTDEASFSVKPALQGCLQCAADSSYAFFQVLLVR